MESAKTRPPKPPHPKHPPTAGNILLVANWDSNVGYAWWLMESFWVAISEHFGEQRHSVLAFPSISVLPEAIANANIQTEQCAFSWENHPTSLSEQLEFIRKHQCEVMYLSDFPLYSLRYLAYRAAGIKKIIIHDHAPGQRSPATGLKRLLKKTLLSIKPISADAVIATSEYIHKRHLESSCIPAKRCYTAANGLPEAEAGIKPADLEKMFGIAKDKTVMLTTGRANTYKGIDFAIRCIAELQKYNKAENLHYLFCGDGPDLEYFKTLAKELDVAHRITFAGRQENIGAIIKAAHFAIHPSKGEVGYSLSILEYMQAGLPVIVPNNPSVCEATEHRVSGLIYQENNINECCEAIDLYASSAEQTAIMGKNARLAIQQQYSLSNTHKALIEAFEKTL